MVTGALAVDPQQLKTIGQERYRREAHVKYLRCPVCRSFMKRRVYGYRSGVVVDSCQAHGVWLDGGEVAHLLEWKKAGGELLQNRLFAQGRHPTQRPSGARDRADADAPTSNQDSSPRTGAAPLDSALELLFRLFE